MNLGTFSVSLVVKDIVASRAFYAALGFVEVGGDLAQRWLVLQNGTATIGLFQGMFERNMLTFNPCWSAAKERDPDGEDVRTIQARLAAAGIDAGEPIVAGTSGAAHFMLTDPDGNPILIDQHV